MAHLWEKQTKCPLRAHYSGNRLHQGRSQGGPGVPVTPPLQAFFNQTTYNRWQKCHVDTLAIVTIWWVPSLWHSVTPSLKNPGYTPGLHNKSTSKKYWKVSDVWLKPMSGKLAFLCFDPSKSDDSFKLLETIKTTIILMFNDKSNTVKFR